jgi:hypothetical protein
MFGGGSAPAPPPPPPPPPNPPTYASAAFNPPSTTGQAPAGLFQSSILNVGGAMGAPSAGATQRKQLFGA